MTKKSLGVEPYDGKQPEDPFGPIDANVSGEQWKVTQPVPSPNDWVVILVAKKAREWDSLSFHHRTQSASFVRDAAVLYRWVKSGNQALHSRSDTDLVLLAMQRSPNDPVDPNETETVKRSRNSALAAARQSILALRQNLP